MRKITIPVSAVLALSAIQMAQAKTFKVDDTVTLTAEQQMTKESTENVTIDGFTFYAGQNSFIATNSNGTFKCYVFGNASTDLARCVEIRPTKAGKLKFELLQTKGSDKNAAVATAHKAVGNLTESEIIKKAVIPNNKRTTVEVELAAGTTYYVLVDAGMNLYSISFEEVVAATSDAYQDVELKIAGGKNSASTELTLQKGTYIFTAPEGAKLELTEGNTACTDISNVVIANNNTKVTVKLVLAGNASGDTKKTFRYAVSDASLNEVKSVYTQKIAVMINKANQYTNDARLQVCAVEASQLMAEANGMGLAQYDEYVTTGKIADLDAKIANLTTKIDNAKASYDGYAYAQEKYGNKYENGAWVLDESNTTSLLAKKAELDAAYKSAQENIKEEAALTALKTVYDDAVAALADFKSTIDAEYKDGKQTNLDAYKADIDKRVGEIKEGDNGVMNTLDVAKNAIVNGDGNAISYANVNTSVNKAKAKYDEEANKLYNLLANNATEKDGDTYRDMYVESLSKLNDYLRVINEVKAGNEAEYKKGTCTTETQAAFEKQLEVIEGIGIVYAEYEEKAMTLRANYKAACNDVKDNLTGYLAEQVKNVIGKKDGKDYKREEVSAFYAEQVAAIEKSIAAIQTNVDDVNKKHTIGDGTAAPYYADYAKDKAAVREVIDALAPKV